jgi:DnaJ-domain-containing protein 1
MSGIDALVAAFGLFIGYWVVAKLLAEHPKSRAPEWFQTLQVSPQASTEEIEQAYRGLIARYYPDKMASLEAEAITAAYCRAMQLRGAHA